MFVVVSVVVVLSLVVDVVNLVVVVN